MVVVLAVGAPQAAPLLRLAGLDLQAAGARRVVVEACVGVAGGGAAPLGGRVAVVAGDRAATGVRVQGAEGAADVRAVGQQRAARGEGVAGRRGQAAGHATQAGARARRGEWVPNATAAGGQRRAQ